MRANHIITAITAITSMTVLTAASGAMAGTVALHHNIRQGVEQGFGFSVLRSIGEDSGSGRILYRIMGTMDTVYDNDANTLTFTGFQADLFRERNLNPDTHGGAVGSLSLVNGLLNIDPMTNLIDGSLTLHMTVDGMSARDTAFLFEPIAFNELANRWDPERFSFGLWGLSANSSSSREDSSRSRDDEEHHRGVGALGIDLLSDNDVAMVPVPSGVALGAVGLAGVFGVRRHRRERGEASRLSDY